MSDLESKQIEIAAKQKKPRIPLEQGSIPEPRDRLGEELAREALAKVEKNEKKPIEEVVSRISDNKDPSNASRGGFIKYSQLVKEAKKDLNAKNPADRPFASKENGQPNDAFQSLVTASAETLVYKSLKEKRSELLDLKPRVASVIHDPVAQIKSSTSLISLLPTPVKKTTDAVLGNIGKQTPDMLVVAPSQTGTIRGRPASAFPGWKDVVNLDDPTSSKLLRKTYRGQTLVSPVEVTISGDPKKIKEKIEKFSQYNNPYPNLSSFKYVPVLMLDRDKYMSLADNKKEQIAKAMKKVGGVIVLEPNLVSEATKLAQKSAQKITTAVQSGKIEGLAPNSTSTTTQTASTAQSSNLLPQITNNSNSAANPQTLSINRTRNTDNSTSVNFAKNEASTSLARTPQTPKPVRISLAELMADDPDEKISLSKTADDNNGKISLAELTADDNNGKVSLAELTADDNNGKVSLAELTADDNQNRNNGPQLGM